MTQKTAKILKHLFQGKWSKATYPRHFPGRMARWSPLIGSSHSKDYIVWQYGGIASPGVTSVSEWGDVEKLEKEMKDQGENVFRYCSKIINWVSLRGGGGINPRVE